MNTDTAKPVRLRRSRAKGSRLVSPNGLPVKCCTRPGKWGNPFRVGETWKDGEGVAFKVETAQDAVDLHYTHVQALVLDDPRCVDELRGKNLACYCKLDSPCHCDNLLYFANRMPAPPSPAAPDRG